MTMLELPADEAAVTADMQRLYDLAWVESGRSGARPGSWRPYGGVGCTALELRVGDELAGCAYIRPAAGMDSIDFIYVRDGEDRRALAGALIEGACERLHETGITRIVYTAFGYWRTEAFPAALAEPFLERGFQLLRGIYMGHPLDPPPLARAAPPGYELRPFDDARVDEAARMMLRCPEPEAIYWDYGLCSRSIAGAASPTRPSFPDGLGQMVLLGGSAHEARCPIVAFVLSTLTGYVNHVYTLPEHRGRGLATTALTHVLAAIRAKGLRRATILTHETNPHAVEIYERLGFRTQFSYPQFFQKR